MLTLGVVIDSVRCPCVGRSYSPGPLEQAFFSSEGYADPGNGDYDGL